MTIGAMDNGMIVYVGERFAGYFAYAVWGAAKRVDAGGRSLFNVLLELFYDGGNAGLYRPYFDAASGNLARELGCFLNTHGNPYFPVPDGTHIKLRDGRHGTVWGLFEACECVARMCEIFPDDPLTAEQICEDYE